MNNLYKGRQTLSCLRRHLCLQRSTKALAQLLYSHTSLHTQWTRRLHKANASSTRFISTSSVQNYDVPLLRDIDRQSVDLTHEASQIFDSAVKAVHPRQMIESVLQLNPATSTLKIKEKTYKLNKNVFIVGMGKAVMGMARAVEDMLGEHIVSGIISIPRGLQQEMKDLDQREMLLHRKSHIEIYEGATNNEVDESAHNAAKAIHALVSKLTEKDILIVLCSGGGSPLFPYPEPPITLPELHTLSQLLTRARASGHDHNTVRKNVEVLKGGGLAKLAKPAQTVSLILSSIVGNRIDLIASGPTCPTHPTPHHCLEILQRLSILNSIPDSIKKFLESEDKKLRVAHEKHLVNAIASKVELDEVWSYIQNVVVGDNTIACQAAVDKATELGYMPILLNNIVSGEARLVGALFAKLAKYIMLCYDRKSSLGSNVELSRLEVDLVAGGIRKKSINQIAAMVDTAHSLNRDIGIISGGETNVQVTGSGTGGKTQELALAMAVHLEEFFRSKGPSKPYETRMAFLCADTDGRDALTNVAGAVIDLDFLDRAHDVGADMKGSLDNNDSHTLFRSVSDGSSLLNTNMTGTNVMDLVVLLVQKPTCERSSSTGLNT